MAVSDHIADYVCVCGHGSREHNGRMYALPSGTRAHGCDVCECAWLCIVPVLDNGADRG